jgi:hypothetical protein
MDDVHDRAPARKAPRQTHWRRLPLSELADQILQIQRTAAHRHLSDREWRMLDRMRRRRAALQKESMDTNDLIDHETRAVASGSAAA